MSGTRGIAMTLRGNDPNNVGITVAEPEQAYKLPNASAFVLSKNEAGLWVETARIILAQD